MLATALAVFAFQQATVSVQTGSQGTFVKIVAREGDSTRKDSTHAKKRSTDVTPAQMASAFADADAKGLLNRARRARYEQDSSINAYDANTVQRFTVGLAFSKFSRERIAFRTEQSSHVRWSRGIGAQIDITGKRSAAPILGAHTEVDIEEALSPVPYFPGRDAFWMGLNAISQSESEDDIVNPLSPGAEAHYTYRTGESVSVQLPSGASIQLRELEVRPRRPDWFTVVGSLWFDVSSGQLVRAAFRMAEPARATVSDSGGKESIVFRALFRPAEGRIDGVAIEYGLHEGRFWLPRSEVIEGGFRLGPMRTPIKIEQQFTYRSVNTLDTLPAMRDRRPAPVIPGDSTHRQKALDSAYAARDKAECDATGKRSVRTDRFDHALPIIVFVPCDTAALAHASTLPPSIYSSGETIYSDADRDELLAKAKSMMPDVPYGLRLPRADFGLNLLRYNRVEGLSGAVDITQSIAPGTTVRFTPRIGTADRVFNGELSLDQSNGAGERNLGVYRRLVASNDWGHPLSFGAGASAFLFGRDEGFYYRATGVEMGGDNLLGHELSWRVFSEKQSDAAAKTDVSVPQAFGADGFGPRDNISAERIQETGASIRKVSSFGIDPNAFRLLSDVRIEGAGGDDDYGRAALDLTLSHPLGRAFSRDFSAAITGGAGTSVGTLPIQRNWFLGGTNTVRGESAGAQAGSSYWLTRTSLGYGGAGVRREAFFDLGWAGDRNSWNAMGRPASGAGIGLSFLDGLIRTDLARGIYPAKQWTFALYLDAKF
ncbi:MAG TPA: BamA/TamA family outer membrane protein [Gemmatimonadaceae bacterium]|jgi:hypothetical protein